MLKRRIAYIWLAIMLLTVAVTALSLTVKGSSPSALSESKKQPSKDIQSANPTHTVQNAETLTVLPDLERIPLYKGAIVLETHGGTGDQHSLGYWVREPISVVYRFYSEAMPSWGWKFLSKIYGSTHYLLTETSEQGAWHLRLVVTLTSLDETATRIDLKYGRYADIGEYVLTLPDAQVVTRTEEVKPGKVSLGGLPIQTVTRTYLTKFSPVEILDYYTSKREEFGWMEYGGIPDNILDPSIKESERARLGAEETRNVRLHFHSAYISDSMKSVMSLDLYITSSLASDGRTLVQLYTEEVEVLDSH